MNYAQALLLLGLLSFVVALPQKKKGGPHDSAREKRKVTLNIIENEIEGKGVDYAKLGDPRVCGVSSRQLSEVTKKGKSAHERDWPWMAMLYHTTGQLGLCGASIITRKHVLTAAHCIPFSKYDNVVVRVGEYDYGQANETEIQDMKIKQSLVHEDYDRATYENDIAIILLEGKIRYTYDALPICLPLPLQHFEGKTAVVAGWGVTAYDGSPSKILKEVAVPVWQEDECINSFSQTVFSTQFCAASYEGGEDACQGDSGGPLFTQREDGKWVQIGVVSWGINCGAKGKPGVYQQVTKYLDWIAPRIRDV